AGVADDRRLRGVEEVVEVLGLEDAPVEGLVLDFIPSEVFLSAGAEGRRKHQKWRREKRLAQSGSCHESPADKAATNFLPNYLSNHEFPGGRLGERGQRTCPPKR